MTFLLPLASDHCGCRNELPCLASFCVKENKDSLFLRKTTLQTMLLFTPMVERKFYLFIFKVFILFGVCVCVCVCVMCVTHMCVTHMCESTCHGASMEVRGQLQEPVLFLPPYGTWGPNSRTSLSDSAAGIFLCRAVLVAQMQIFLFTNESFSR